MATKECNPVSGGSSELSKADKWDLVQGVELRGTLKHLLHHLHTFVGDNAYCFPSRKLLASRVCVQHKTVSNLTLELEKLGVITRGWRQNPGYEHKQRIYRINYGQLVKMQSAESSFRKEDNYEIILDDTPPVAVAPGVPANGPGAIDPLPGDHRAMAQEDPSKIKTRYKEVSPSKPEEEPVPDVFDELGQSGICERVHARWNEAMDRTDRLTRSRQRSIQARFRDPYWQDNWEEAIQTVAAGGYALGENERGWCMDLEFFLREDTVTKIIEGSYVTNIGVAPISKAQLRENQNANSFRLAVEILNKRADRHASAQRDTARLVDLQVETQGQDADPILPADELDSQWDDLPPLPVRGATLLGCS